MTKNLVRGACVVTVFMAAGQIARANARQASAADAADSKGRVTATIDGKEFVWDTPTPDTESCSVSFGTFRVDFRSSKNGTTIKMGSIIIEVGLEDGWVYSQQLVGANKKKGSFTVEGKTVTYEGLLRHTPKMVKSGTKVEIKDVQASITANCG